MIIMENKKILSYVYLVSSILIILSLLSSTIYFYKQSQQFKSQYDDYISNNIYVCVCPQLNPNKLCEGRIHPQCVGEWEIINGECSWNCQLGLAKIK